MVTSVCIDDKFFFIAPTRYCTLLLVSTEESVYSTIWLALVRVDEVPPSSSCP